MSHYLHGTDVLVGFDALADHYIVARVNHVDVDKLRAALTAPPEPNKDNTTQMKLVASLLPVASGVVDQVPKLALSVGLPFAQKALKDYGIDVTITSASVPPEKGGKEKSEFLPGAIVGAIVGTGLFYGGRALYLKLKK